MNGIKDIIKKLDQQRVAIERALSALREMDGTGVDGAAPAMPAAGKAPRKAKRKGGMTPEGRRRLSEALRARWAAKRAGAAAPVAKTKRKAS